MPAATDYRAVGRILAVEDGAVLFQPCDTKYELRLVCESKPNAPLNKRIECLVRVSARKVYSVPSGGSLIAPIVGPPRIVQGWIKYLDENTMVVRAGTWIIIELPKEDWAYDLAEGPLTIGKMANVAALAGARIEDVREPAFAG